MKNWSMRWKLYLYPDLLKELPELDDQIRMERDKVFSAYDCSSTMLTGMPGSSSPGDPCGNTVVNQVLPGWERYDALCQRRRAKQAIVMDAWLRLLLLTILFLIEAIWLCFMIRIIGNPFASPVMMPKQPQKMVVLAIEDVQVGGGSNTWTPEHLTALRETLTRAGNWKGGCPLWASTI